MADAEVAAALARDWDLAVTDLRYVPAGFGGYHWSADDADGGRWFVTASDLARYDSFAGLERAMFTAVRLAQAGLEFVVAPVLAASGRATSLAGSRYAITVSPFVDGTPGRWGDPMTTADRAAVTGMLARLHAVRGDPGDVPVRALELPDRGVIDASLRERAGSWQTGPYGEPARVLLNEHAASLVKALHTFDELTAEFTASAGELVITHGEPQAGNLIRSHDGLLLIDWDLVRASPARAGPVVDCLGLRCRGRTVRAAHRPHGERGSAVALPAALGSGRPGRVPCLVPWPARTVRGRRDSLARGD